MSYRKFSNDEDTQLITTVDLNGIEIGTIHNPLPIGFGDSPSIDAFSRLRVSTTSTMFDAQHHYGQKHHLFLETLTAGGTITDVMDESAIRLTVTSAIGDKVVNRSRRFYYVAGQSHLIACTGVFGASVAGIRKAVGFYDNDDGVRFEQGIDGVVSLISRTSTTGTPVDTAVAQADWNLDPMDGTGASGIDVDWTKSQIFMFDFQWLGVGRVRAYLDIDGHLYHVHEFLNANAIATVYMQTPHLPVTYEIENVSAVAGDGFDQICAAVFTEGLVPDSQIVHAMSNSTTGVVCANGTLTHVLSIRPAQLFNGRTNKGMIIPVSIEVFVTGQNPTYFELLEDATVSGAFAAHGHANSMVEHLVGTDGTYTAATGHARDSGYASTGGKRGGSPINTQSKLYRMQIDPAGVPDVLTLVAAGIGGSSKVFAKIKFEEFY